MGRSLNNSCYTCLIIWLFDIWHETYFQNHNNECRRKLILPAFKEKVMVKLAMLFVQVNGKLEMQRWLTCWHLLTILPYNPRFLALLMNRTEHFVGSATRMCVQRQETFVVWCPFCLRRCKKLCLCMSSLLDRTRVAVHKQSFLHLLRQNGRHVSKVYSTNVFAIGELVISLDKETAEQIMANCRYII